jgi:hypothetical protein
MCATREIFNKLAKESNRPADENSPNLGPIFRTFFPGKIPWKISRKILPQKCWEKIEFSMEKVLKNRFSKKFHGIFLGK